VSTHVAGPELDRLVAEKVLGWHLEPSGPDMGDGNWHDADGHFKHCSPKSFIGLRAWNPSTSVAHAWEIFDAKPEWSPIVGRVTAKHPMAAMLGTLPHSPWMCEIMPGGKGQTHWADSAPLAICLAALAAVGGEA
jgi:hypothetical protein